MGKADVNADVFKFKSADVIESMSRLTFDCSLPENSLLLRDGWLQSQRFGLAEVWL